MHRAGDVATDVVGVANVNDSDCGGGGGGEDEGGKAFAGDAAEGWEGVH